MARYAETPFLERLEREVVVGDGATGSLLYARGVAQTDCFEHLNLAAPALVRQVHADYLAAGARLIETNSFRGSSVSLGRHGIAEQTVEINRAAAKLAKEAVRGEAYVAGSVGPIGKRIQGREADPLSLEDRLAIYGEQIQALAEGGADLILLETFLSLDDLLAAFQAARARCKLPVVAQMAFIRNNQTYEGVSVEGFAQAMQKAGADVLGANCGHGTVGAVGVSKALASLGVTRISAFPNSGFPDYVDGRYLYRNDPGYFAGRALEAVDAGARVVGGCCGTGPDDIRALVKLVAARGAMPMAMPRRSSPAGRNAPAKVAASGTIEPIRSVRAPGVGHFLDDWKKRKIVTVELDPPRGGDFRKVIEGAKLCKQAGADAISIADNPLAIVRMSNIALGHLVQQEAGIPVIVHYAGRDRNLLGLRSDLMGASALGLDTAFMITGDPASIGDAAGATSVYDLNSFGLVSLAHTMNRGESPGAPPTGFRIGVAYNPNAKNLQAEAGRLRKKIALGAHFVQTQAVYDARIAREAFEAVKDLGVPILFGIMPFLNLKNAEFVAHEVPGIVVPEKIMARMRQARDAAAEGVAIAEELIAETAAFASGFYLLPPFNKAELACKLLSKISAKKTS